MEEEKDDCFEIRDKRDKERFFLDNEFFNGYVKLLGVDCLAVYCSLCRHADNDTQGSHPSQKKIAEELALSRQTVNKCMGKLEKCNIIKKSRVGKKCNNRYWLTKKSSWVDKKDVMSTIATSSDVNHGDITCQPRRHHVSTTATSIVTELIETELKETTSAKNGGRDEKEIIPDLLVDKKKHIQIIGIFVNIKKITFENKEQQSSFIVRNVREAKNLVPYALDRIIIVMEKLRDTANYDWKLSTVGKFIDSDLSKLESFGQKNNNNPYKNILDQIRA